MSSPRGSCPSGYNWYVCALSTYNGCCRIDPCSLPQGCPPDDQFSSTLPGGTGTVPAPSPGTSATGSPSARVKASSTSPVSPTAPPVSGLDPTSSSPVHTSTPAFSTSGTASSALSTSAGSNSGGNSKDTNPVPQAVIVGATIGGVLIILIIILIIMLCRRRRESKNSANDLPNYDSEPSPGDGAVRAERNGFLALFTRTRPMSAAKATTMPTDSPSTTFSELPTSNSRHNSLVPGFVELASPPISPVSGLSSGDRMVYSSTNVSTASTGAVVSPHETLRGGARPVMSPNMAHRGREGRKHALSWQNLESGDGS